MGESQQLISIPNDSEPAVEFKFADYSAADADSSPVASKTHSRIAPPVYVMPALIDRDARFDLDEEDDDEDKIDEELAFRLFPELAKPEKPDAPSRDAGRMTIIESTVPMMYREKNENLNPKQKEAEKTSKLLKRMTPKQRELYLARREGEISRGKQESEIEAMKHRSDVITVKKNIAKIEVMLAKYALTVDNRRDMELKLDHWISMLHRHLQGPMSNAERYLDQRRMEDRMEFFHRNKGLKDVFDIFWYLVLPHCISNDEGEDFLPKKGYILFNSNLYIALTGTKDKTKVLKHAQMNWIEDTREMNEGENGTADENYDPPEGVELVDAPLRFNLPEGCLITCLTKDKFFLSIFQILDTWAELVSPHYYSIFAWSILDSIGDTAGFPPTLRLPNSVPCCTNLARESEMLTNFNDTSKLRNFLLVPQDNLSRIPEVLARLAARKKGTTINEDQSQRIKMIYDKLRREGKIYVNTGDTDSDDSDYQRKLHEAKEKAKWENSGNGGKQEMDDDDSDNSEARRRKAELEYQRLKISEQLVKDTATFSAKQRTKFVKDSSLDMRNQKKTRSRSPNQAKFCSADPKQQQHTEFLNFSSKPSDDDLAKYKADQIAQRARLSPVVSNFRGPNGEVVSHWQYGSVPIPATDILDDTNVVTEEQEMENFRHNYMKKGTGNWRAEFAKIKFNQVNNTLHGQGNKVLVQMTNSDHSAKLLGRKATLMDKFRKIKEKREECKDYNIMYTKRRGRSSQPLPDPSEHPPITMVDLESLEQGSIHSKRSIVSIPSVVSLNKPEILVRTRDSIKPHRAPKEVDRQQYIIPHFTEDGDGEINDRRGIRGRERKRFYDGIEGGKSDFSTMKDSIASTATKSALLKDYRILKEERGRSHSPKCRSSNANSPSPVNAAHLAVVESRGEIPSNQSKIRTKKVSNRLQSMNIMRRVLSKAKGNCTKFLGGGAQFKGDNPGEEQKSIADLFEDSRDIDLALDDVLYTDQGVAPPDESWEIADHDINNDVNSNWFHPVNLSDFATSSIIGNIQSGSLLSLNKYDKSVLNQAMRDEGISPSFLSASLAESGTSTWGNSLEDDGGQFGMSERRRYVNTLTLARDKHKQERAKRQQARADNRIKRRKERSYRLDVLQEDIRTVRSAILSSLIER